MSSVKKLIAEAKEIKKEQDKFLVVYDIVNSTEIKNKKGWNYILNVLKKFHSEINNKYKRHLAKGELTLEKEINGFVHIHADNGGGFLNNPEIIESIINYGRKTLPFKLKWAVGRNAWDKRIKI